MWMGMVIQILIQMVCPCLWIDKSLSEERTTVGRLKTPNFPEMYLEDFCH